MSGQLAKRQPVVALFCASLAAAAILLAMPAQAWGNWNFDPSCSAIEVSEVADPATPNALLMLDQSGSMGSLTDSDNNSLWSVAVNAINQATAVLDDDIRFGLGLFPASDCNEYCILGLCFQLCGIRSGAAEVVEAQYESSEVIEAALDETGPSGGTPTWAALNEIRASVSMNDPNHPAGGVLITDGQPCCHDSARKDTIDAACELRDEGYLTYAVGLGGATDQDFNNKMAAALGTGCCGPSANEDCTNGLGADPCSSSVSGTACYGSFQAYNQTEFRNVLLAIGEEIACTFPIDTSLHSAGEAPEDPGAVRVELLTAEGWTRLDHRDHSDDGEGWYYPTTDSRNQVTLTEEYCSMVQAGHVDTVETQLACECQEEEGVLCDVNNPAPGTCPQGVWTCTDGYDLCVPMGPNECPVDCPGFDEVIGNNCHLDWSPEEMLDADPADYQYPLSRCEVGEVICPAGALEPVCESRYRPMPEICDGMDNSCDGKVDNIEESWTDWYGASTWEEWMDGRGGDFSDSGDWDSWPVGLDLPDDLRGAACGIEDICSCPDGGADAHSGEGATVEEEFAHYLESRDSGCTCVAPMR